MIKWIRLKPFNSIVVLLMVIVGLAVNNIWDRQALEDCMQQAVTSESDMPEIFVPKPVIVSVPVTTPVRRKKRSKRKSNKVGVTLPVAGGGLFGRRI